jgi:hypothetical protein
MSVSCDSCVLSGRGLCDGPITRLEESYRLCCVCDLIPSTVRRPRPTRAVETWKEKNYLNNNISINLQKP